MIQLSPRTRHLYCTPQEYITMKAVKSVERVNFKLKQLAADAEPQNVAEQLKETQNEHVFASPAFQGGAIDNELYKQLNVAFQLGLRNPDENGARAFGDLLFESNEAEIRQYQARIRAKHDLRQKKENEVEAPKVDDRAAQHRQKQAQNAEMLRREREVRVRELQRKHLREQRNAFGQRQELLDQTVKAQIRKLARKEATQANEEKRRKQELLQSKTTELLLAHYNPAVRVRGQ